MQHTMHRTNASDRQLQSLIKFGDKHTHTLMDCIVEDDGPVSLSSMSELVSVQSDSGRAVWVMG